MAIARGQAPAPPIPITAYQLDLLRELFRKHSTSQQTAERIHILLLAYEGYSNSHVSRVLNISLNTVKKWRTRWLMDYENLVKFESQVVKEKISLLTFQKRLLSVIKDKPAVLPCFIDNTATYSSTLIFIISLSFKLDSMTMLFLSPL